MTTVILDNYDSFTFNLVQLVGELGEAPLVFRNDAISTSELARIAPDRIILSPGPGNPENAASFGVCRDAIVALGPTVPILGVCLGHQGICSAFGARVVRARSPMHGKASTIHHDGSALFNGIPRAFEAMRYHSLVVDPSSVPACLRVTATTEDGVVMAVAHAEHPIFGVQFHPESIGTPAGRRLLENFISLRR